MAALENTVGELQVMTGVLLALVVLLLLLLAVAALFLHNSKTLADFQLPVFFRNNNKSQVQEKQPHKSCNGVDPHSTVVKMPNSQVRSPFPSLGFPDPATPSLTLSHPDSTPSVTLSHPESTPSMTLAHPDHPRDPAIP